jgi:hypothetical protein
LLTLSRELGVVVGELERSLTERELREYAAHLSYDPPLADRLDYWGSQIVAVLLNVNRSKGQAVIEPAKLVPDWWGERVPDVKARRRKLREMFRALAATGS